MYYENFLKEVSNYESDYELADILYFESLIRFKLVQNDVRIIDDKQHIDKVLKIFLTNWGLMGRVVDREAMKWGEIANTLRSSEQQLAPLREEKFLTVNFEDKGISDSIKTIYANLGNHKHAGATTQSKILHLLNPEIFVMWDVKILQYHHKDNRLIEDSPDGYLEFLKMSQRKIIETLNQLEKEKGKNSETIVRELKEQYPYKYNNSLTKTIAKFIDEYNWLTVPR